MVLLPLFAARDPSPRPSSSQYLPYCSAQDQHVAVAAQPAQHAAGVFALERCWTTAPLKYSS